VSDFAGVRMSGLFGKSGLKVALFAQQAAKGCGFLPSQE
jgi:hypothetical protein